MSHTETFFRPNIFKTDTETFFETHTDTLKKMKKKSRDEMSHSAVLVREAVKNVLADFVR